MRNNSREYQGNNYKIFKPQDSTIKELAVVLNKKPAQKVLLKCWEFGGTCYFKDCQTRKRNFNVHSIQEAVIVWYMDRSMPEIYAALENQQEDHETSMVEIEGMINNQPISILIDLGASLSYISPRIVYLCNLVPQNVHKAWIVQLATSTKQKVTRLIRNCKVMMHAFLMHVNVNFMPLGSYDLLIGMDWLE